MEPQRFQIPNFLRCEQPRLRQKPFSKRNFDGEARTATFGHIDGELRVLPIFKLVFAHPEFTILDGAQTNVTLSELEIAFFKTHGLRSIAATAALVKH